MNIFVLRNKLRSIDAGTRGTGQTKLKSPVESPHPVRRPEIPLAIETLPERIGLDEIFELTDKQLHKLSPTGNFSKLKAVAAKPTCGHSASIVSARETQSARPAMGLNAMLTIDTSDVEKWLLAQQSI